MKKSIPKLNSGEQLILQNQGGYRLHSHSGWRVIELFLTNQRLILFQLQKIAFEVDLRHVTQLDTEKLYYVLRKREALCVCYQAHNGLKAGRIWFIVNDPKMWKKNIHQMALLKVNAKIIESIAVQVDSESRDILWYFWENRHATISQLADLIHAPNHMHVLTNIRDTINPISEKVVGCAILSFERSCVDPETGETILFSWWLLGEPEDWDQHDNRLLDIFDEETYIQAILEVRRVDKADLKLEVNKNALIVKSGKKGAAWTEIIHLPAEVKIDDHKIHLRNNLLEIKLLKSSAYCKDIQGEKNDFL